MAYTVRYLQKTGVGVSVNGHATVVAGEVEVRDERGRVLIRQKATFWKFRKIQGLLEQARNHGDIVAALRKG